MRMRVWTACAAIACVTAKPTELDPKWASFSCWEHVSADQRDSCIHTYNSHYHTSLLENEIVAGFDHVFPSDLFEQMIKEANQVADYVDSQNEGFVHGKKTTYFVDLEHGKLKGRKPRFALERAIEILTQLDYPTDEERKNIYGAEWWVQRRSATENIGFHYDKDEAAASLHSLLKCPTEGTITYMSSDGSPTVILNRTTPQGNDPEPFLVSWAALSYPKHNRHVIFRGNLAHGVAGSLSQSKEARVTFLVNYWQYKPIEPNCIHVSDTLMRSIGLGSDTLPSGKPMAGATSNAEVVPIQNADLSAGGDLVEVELRKDDHWFIEVPRDLKPGLWNFSWQEHQVANLLQVLNLDDEEQMDKFWESPVPKMLIFATRPGRQSQHDEGVQAEFKKVTTAVFPAFGQFIRRFEFFFAEPHTSADVIEAFGLQPADLPAIGIQYTHNNADDKYALTALDLAAEKVLEFIKDFFAGKLEPLIEGEKEEL